MGKKYKSNKENTLAARSSLLSDEMLQMTKPIVIGTRSAGTVISRRMFIAIGTGASLFLASFRAYIVHFFLFFLDIAISTFVIADCFG